MTATGYFPGASCCSSAWKKRPATGLTPSTSKKFPDTNSAQTRSAWVSFPRLKGPKWYASAPARERDESRKSRKSGYEELLLFSPSGSDCSSETRRCPSATPCKGLSSTPRAQLNTVVFAPIPTASVTITTAASQGVFANERTAYFSSEDIALTPLAARSVDRLSWRAAPG